MLSPKTRQALDYWQSKAAGRGMPSRADIDPADMIAFLPNVVLIDVLRDPLDFRYRLTGTLIDEHIGRSVTGWRMSEIAHQKPPSRIWSACERVVRERAPLSSDVPYVGPKRDFVVAEDIIMPLSPDDGAVTMLLVVVDYLRKVELPEDYKFGHG